MNLCLPQTFGFTEGWRQTRAERVWVKSAAPGPELTLQEEGGGGGGVGLRPGLFGHAVAHRNQDVLLRGRDRWVRRGRIRVFGWSFHVHFGTHDGLPVLHSGPLEHKRPEQRCLYIFYLLFYCRFSGLCGLLTFLLFGFLFLETFERFRR